LHDLRLRLPYWLFAVLGKCVFQHCTGGLRTRAAVTVVGLDDALGMWTIKADEDHTAALVFRDPIHDAECTRFFLPRCARNQLSGYFRLREGAYVTML
jgi:hypothetical protein